MPASAAGCYAWRVRFSHFLVAAALGAGSAATAAPAAAQGAPAPAGGASDIVRLKDGTVLRGTISELVPGRYVEIVIASGRTRRIPMQRVAYAGPIANDPSMSAPPGAGPAPGAAVTMNAPPVRLQLTADKPGIEFHRKVGMDQGYANYRGGMGRVSMLANRYQLICAAPCSVSVPAGTHTLALAKDGAPIAAEPVYVDGDGKLQGEYTSYKGARIAGTVISVVGALVGLYFILTSIDYDGCEEEKEKDKPCDQVEVPRMLGGFGVLVGGAIIGGILSSIDDDAEITFFPAVSTDRPYGGPESEDGVGGDTSSRRGGFNLGMAPGLTFGARF